MDCRPGWQALSYLYPFVCISATMIRTLALLAGPVLSIALVSLFGIEVLFGCLALVLLTVAVSCAAPRLTGVPRELAEDDVVHTLI